MTVSGYESCYGGCINVLDLESFRGLNNFVNTLKYVVNYYIK